MVTYQAGLDAHCLSYQVMLRHAQTILQKAEAVRSHPADASQSLDSHIVLLAHSPAKASKRLHLYYQVVQTLVKKLCDADG